MEIERIAALSKLKLTEEERESFSKNFAEVLEFANKINELDTEAVEPTLHIAELYNVLREDEIKEGLSQQEILQNAPEQKYGAFIVPRVLE